MEGRPKASRETMFQTRQEELDKDIEVINQTIASLQTKINDANFFNKLLLKLSLTKQNKKIEEIRAFKQALTEFKDTAQQLYDKLDEK